jgi:hypothetical protein
MLVDLLLLAAAGIAALFVAIHIWTFRRILRQDRSAWWSRGAALAASVGFVAGLASGVLVRWRPEADTEYIGFPIPGIVLLYENGRWVDYVGPTVLVCPLLNALLVGTVFVLPFTIAMVVRRRD